MREEEICVGHKGIKGQLNNSGHIFQAGGGVLWAANEALYQSALRLCVSETSEGEELKPDSELIWRRERVCRQESRRLPWCLMCWVALRDHLELSLSQITATHTPFTSSRWILSLTHTHTHRTCHTSPNLTFPFTQAHKQSYTSACLWWMISHLIYKFKTIAITTLFAQLYSTLKSTLHRML